MGAVENLRHGYEPSSVDRWLDAHNARLAGWKEGAPHPLEEPAMKRRHTQLYEWYMQEREKQAANRYQMAIDQDFYDNLQWDEKDIQELAERGQAALVFNVTATTVDWVIGTQKRTRVDFKVYPRAEDDVEPADAKTKTLKYLSDVNKTGFARSLAFADAVKVGVGWMEDGCRGDPGEEPIFSRYENWRNIIWDSSGSERDGSDWRYLFRWKWVDLDIALTIWPDRADKLRQAAVAANLFGNEDDDDFWYLGQRYQARDARGEVLGRRTFINDVSTVDNRRARVRLIEAWYRVPERCFICRGDVFDGEVFDKSNPVMARAAIEGAVGLVDQISMRVRTAIMTESHLIHEQLSPYRHKRFPFTPTWCYIRGRDRMPYGMIRRWRDIQEDLNKRSSKALFLLSTNRMIADVDAIEGTGLTWDDVREEKDRPDALMTKKRGTEMEWDNNVQMGEEHLHLADRDERMIQAAGGVTDENLGRRTNAVSGEAIKARQLQGSVVTAEIFDNDRYAFQNEGETQLSLVEQFMSEPKVMRLIGARKKIEWVKINQPEVQPDGSVRFLNDVTASKADFVVDAQDYHQSVRQAMFETMTELVGKIAAINVEAGLRILRMALEFSDLPNKDEMASEIKDMLGLVDEEELQRMTPDERQAYQQQMAAKQHAAQLAQAAAELEVKERAAKVQKLEAEAGKIAADAEKISAEAQALLRGDGGELVEAKAEFNRKTLEIEQRAAAAIDKARQELERVSAEARDEAARLQAESRQEIAQLQVKANDRQGEIAAKERTDVKVAEINAKAKIDEAKIVQQFDSTMKELMGQVKELASELKAITSKADKLEADAERGRVEGAAREKAEKETKVKEDRERKERDAAEEKKAKAAKDEQPKGPLVVFEEGAIQVNGAPAVEREIEMTIGGKKVTATSKPKTAKKKD